MPFILAGLGIVLFMSIIIFLSVREVFTEKDRIIGEHLQGIRQLEEKIKKIDQEDHKHKLWLIDVAHLTKITEIKRLLINYAQPKQPKKEVDPKAKK